MYTSGRTVKSKVAKPTTVATATADVRKLVRRYLSGVEGITVESTRTADPITLAAQVRTVVTWPSLITDDHVRLGMAIAQLPGYLRASNDECSITFYRAV